MARLPAQLTSLLSALPQIDTPPSGFMGSDDPMAGLPDDDGLQVAFETPAEPTFALDENGDMVEVLPDEDQLPAASTPEHVRNLAEDMPEDVLTKIASDLIDDVEQDIEDRAPHMRRFQRGLEMLGLTPDELDDGAFPGAASVTHNLISEAIVQFWARALPEMVPSEGPAKALVVGKQSKQLQERARRISDYMNFDILTQDDGWYAEMSRAMFAVPTTGDAFKKIYRDPVLQKNVSIYVNSEDFIVPWNVTDLRTAPRFTHRIWRTPTEIKKAQAQGYYRKVKLDAPDSEDLPEATQLRIEVQDLEPTSLEDNARHELYEVNVEMELPGYEHGGIPCPYVITIDKSTEKVLSIYRNWKEADPLKRRRLCWVKYSYVPGMGFYSLGLFHLLGGIQDGATGALRAILDGAATASLQGGFVAKDANLRGQNLAIEPGVWKAVEATSEDLAKAFFSPPFKEPSPALFNTLQFLTQRGEKFAATTELMTGETNAKAPVGSVVAVIEQAAKVFSTIHRGLHMAMAQELLLRKELIQEYMPPEGYPYDVDGAHEGLLADDFAPGVSVVPVSDPNIFSSSQRVAIAQVAYDLATANPDVMRRPVAVRRMLEAARVPDVDELMITSEPPPPMDPISQVQALLRGEPVQAYPDQLHQAHVEHLTSFLSNPGFGGNPQVQQQIGPMAMALVGQHLAYLWATHARGMGVPAPLLPPPMQGEGGDQQQPGTASFNPQQLAGMLEQAGQQQPVDIQFPMGGQPMGGAPMGQAPVPTNAPPEVIAQMAAQIAPNMAQVPGIPVPPDPAGEAKAEAQQADTQIKTTDAQMKMQHAQELHQQKLQSQQRADEIKLRDAELKQQAEAQKLAEREQAMVLKAEAAQNDQTRADMQLGQQLQQAEQQAQIDVAAQIEDRQRAEEQAAMDAALQASQAEHDRALAEAQAVEDMSISRQQAAHQAELSARQAQNDMSIKKKAAAQPKKSAPKRKR